MSRRICHCWSSRIRVRRSTKYGQESFNSAHALKRGTLAKGFLGKKSGYGSEWALLVEFIPLLEKIPVVLKGMREFVFLVFPPLPPAGKSA